MTHTQTVEVLFWLEWKRIRSRGTFHPMKIQWIHSDRLIGLVSLVTTSYRILQFKFQPQRILKIQRHTGGYIQRHTGGYIWYHTTPHHMHHTTPYHTIPHHTISYNTIQYHPLWFNNYIPHHSYILIIFVKVLQVERKPCVKWTVWCWT